jgi:hypothetical protein
VPEPHSTAHLRGLLGRARAGFTPAQRAAEAAFDASARHEPAVLRRLRQGDIDLPTWRRLARTTGAQRAAPLDDRISAVPGILALGEERPAVASALLWELLGTAHPALASCLIQLVRERAGLVALRRAVDAAEIDGDPVTWFADRQLADAARWMQRMPAPEADTLMATMTATEAQRSRADRLDIGAVAGFLRRAAAFFAHLAAAGVDPLGFALGREARIDVDPVLGRRVELAAWARGSGCSVCLRGRMIVLEIDVEAPWPLVIEVLASELGRGVCGGGGLLMRLGGGAAPSIHAAPVLLWLPGEPVEQLGARFERWLAGAYPRAVDAWRGRT